MSLTILLLMGLCAFCTAQNPPPPMADTFQGSGEVEFHGAESTVFGRFVMARDQMKQMGYEREEYDEGSGRPAEVTETLIRYDLNRTYYIRGDKANPHCIEEGRNYPMSKFWSWLDYSTYEGSFPIREVMYDTWATDVGGVHFEFGRPKTNASILYFFRRKTTESSVFYSFMDFKTVPDPVLFQVPPECKEMRKTL